MCWLAILLLLPVTVTQSLVSAWTVPVLKSYQTDPISRSILLFGDGDMLSEDIVYLQSCTNTRILGKAKLLNLCRALDANFSDDHAVTSLNRCSQTAPLEWIVQWNVSWVPASSAWLMRLADACGWEVEYRPYNRFSNSVSVFSWTAVWNLFRVAFATGKLRVPTACIEGTSLCRLDSTNTKVTSVTETLAYASDLKRGRLQNRRCAADLRYFLETARHLQDDPLSWEGTVATSLPWSSVPGSNPLDVEETQESSAGVIFTVVVGLAMLSFANAVGPELVGQSLFGPTSYIVAPVEELQMMEQ